MARKKARKIRKLPAKKQIAFLRNTLPLAKANMSQKEIAKRLVEFGNKQEKAMGQAALNAMESGGTFSSAIEPWLNTMAWEALMAGEKIGDWAKGIINALGIMDVGNKVGGSIFLALLQPIGTILVMLAAMAAAHISFFPKIADLYPPSRWAGLSTFANEMGGWLVSWAGTVGIAFALLLGFVIYTLYQSTGAFRAKLDKLPIYRQYRMIQANNLLRSMGNLALAGFGLKESINSTLKHANRYQAYHLKLARKHIGKGERNVGRIFNTGLLEPAEQSTLMILGEKGNYGKTLIDCADIAQASLLREAENIKYWTRNILSLLGGMLFIILAGGVAMLMLDLSTSIK
ncbi:hypothetical protein ACPV5G_20210 [Photobacterium damselae]|uniref:hypothetical protein n=1 Tax=Photobacterium damselae TaxID=38293 RepID=UPI004067871B